MHFFEQNLCCRSTSTFPHSQHIGGTGISLSAPRIGIGRRAGLSRPRGSLSESHDSPCSDDFEGSFAATQLLRLSTSTESTPAPSGHGLRRRSLRVRARVAALQEFSQATFASVAPRSNARTS
jgi:hypothetical protein